MTIKTGRFWTLSTFVAVLLTIHPAFASNPSSATLNPAVGSAVAWTGTGLAGVTTDETTCVDGTDCDVFTVTLSGSPSDYRSLALAISITHNLAINDYDLFVHKGGLTGPVVASSTGGVPETSEAVIIDPTVTGTGIYTVHVVDSAVAPGDVVSGLASIIVTPNVNHQATGTAPTYASSQSPAHVTNPSAQPSIRATF